MNKSLKADNEVVKEAAIKRLSEQLHFRMEQLDPQDPTQWNELDDIDKNFYRYYIQWLLHF